MEMRFTEIAEKFISGGGKLRPFHPFPAAVRRAEYERLPAQLKKRLIKMGEAYLDFAYPALRATDYMAFTRRGSRVDYEDIYFKRRYALNSLAVAECIEYRGRFLDDIINGIFALCEESGWQLPAHNSYPGGSQEPIPDRTRPILDLFACETGAQLACIRYLLGDKLDAVSPNITKRIDFELENRIITPYTTQHFWWMGNGDEPMCNWTPWCTQNVLLTFFLGNASDKNTSAYSTTTGRSILYQAAKSCDFFLKDYGDDGCCDEGAQYFRHAGLCLDGGANILNQITGGAFAEVFHWEKIKNIAAYIFNVHVEDKYYFNFADCSPVAGRAGVREYLFGRRTEQADLMRFAAEDFQKTENNALFEDESHLLNLFYRMQAVFCYEEIMAYDCTAPLMHRDIFYPSVGLFLARNHTFSLAVKAGGNDDSHNHNDTGSITVYKNGHPILVDIGVESYTQKTFSDRRYEIWTMQSGYHNLPAIDGIDQHNGREYCAADVITAFDNASGKAFIFMELAGAYPLPEPRSYVRKVVFFKKENYIALVDETDSRNVILNFITCEQPEIIENAAEASHISAETDKDMEIDDAKSVGICVKVGIAQLVFRGAKLMEIETLPITDKRLKTAWEHDLYRIRLKMSEEIFEMDIK